MLTIKAVMACSLAAATWVRSGAPESFPTAFAEVFFAHHTCRKCIGAQVASHHIAPNAVQVPLGRAVQARRFITLDAIYQIIFVFFQIVV